MTWQSLGASPAELTLDFTLPTGQSFRWRRTGEAEFTGVVDNRVVSCRHAYASQALLACCANTSSSSLQLRTGYKAACAAFSAASAILQVKVQQMPEDVKYQVVARGESASSAEDAAVLRDYFNLQACLEDLCLEWSNRDGRFKSIHTYFPGKTKKPGVQIMFLTALHAQTRLSVST